MTDYKQFKVPILSISLAMLYLCKSYHQGRKSILMQLKLIQVIHLAFCSMTFIFGALCFFMNQNTLYFGLNLGSYSLIYMLTPIFAIITLLMGPYLSERMIAKIDPALTSNQKFKFYQSAFILKCAFFGAGAIANLVLFLITANSFFILFATACLLSLWLSRPKREKVLAELQLPLTTQLDGI